MLLLKSKTVFFLKNRLGGSDAGELGKGRSRETNSKITVITQGYNNPG